MNSPHPPKVAIVIATGHLSGAENRATKIYMALRKRGYPVELWINPALRPLLASAYPDIAELAIDNPPRDSFQRWLRPIQRNAALWAALEYSRLPARLGSPAFEEQLVERNIGLVHLFLETQIAHIRNKPVLFELTSPDIADLMGMRPKPRRLSHTAYHAVSPGVAKRFINLAPEVPLIEAPSPFFQSRQTELRSLQMTKTKTIVFAHRFIRRKNAVLFARVARRFVNLESSWQIRILGRGVEEPEIRNIVADAPSRIEVGYDPNLSQALARSRIFVSLIEPDNFPSQSVMEAMTAGNALLLSNTGDSAEKFVDGNGVTTELDEEKVLGALLDLTSDEDRLEAMGERSRALAQQRFNADRYLDHLIDVYQDVALRGSHA